MAKPKKDRKMREFGLKGQAGLVAKLGSPEAITAHYRKIAKRRWKLHPEQRKAKEA